MYFRAYRGTAALRKEIKNKWETRRSLKPSAGGTPKNEIIINVDLKK